MENIRTWGKANHNLVDRIFLVNAAYASIHGYGYVFFTAVSHGSREPTWARVPAMNYMLKECPDSYLLALDTDAYIRNMVDPFDLALFPKLGYTLAFSLECQWFVQSQSSCMAMGHHQEMFEKTDWEVGNTGALNTGVIFVINPRTAAPLLSEWYNFTNDPRWEGKKYNRDWPQEQKALSEWLQWGNISRRKDVMMLDPSKYNGPEGRHIRHLYGFHKTFSSARSIAMGDHDLSDVLTLAITRLRQGHHRRPDPQFVENFPAWGYDLFEPSPGVNIAHLQSNGTRASGRLRRTDPTSSTGLPKTFPNTSHSVRP